MTLEAHQRTREPEKVATRRPPPTRSGDAAALERVWTCDNATSWFGAAGRSMRAPFQALGARFVGALKDGGCRPLRLGRAAFQWDRAAVAILRVVSATGEAIKMATKKKAPPVPLARDELESRLRGALGAAGTLTQNELLKKLPRNEQANGLGVLQELAAHGDIFRLASGQTVKYFRQDPIARIEELVPRLLDGKSLTKADLQQRVERDAPGHGKLFSEWHKGALARGVIFEQASSTKSSKDKTFGTKPDLRRLFKKSLAALLSDVRHTDASNISRDAVIDFLVAELGGSERRSRPKLAELDPAPDGEAESQLQRVPFLTALERLSAKNPSGALISVRELRGCAGLDKRTFDATALALSSERAVVLHHHDHAGSLPEAERQSLVKDAHGTHYVGIALRGEP